MLEITSSEKSLLKEQSQKHFNCVKCWFNHSPMEATPRGVAVGRYVLALACVLGALGAFCGPVGASDQLDMNRLADAVYRSEGGSKASVPYGLIYSGWCKDEPGWCGYYAKEVMRVHLTRCRDGEDATQCIGRQYCPPTTHRLNINWVRNVRFYYEKG